jgi:hypothetical protein
MQEVFTGDSDNQDPCDKGRKRKRSGDREKVGDHEILRETPQGP